MKNATFGWYSVNYGGVHTISVNPYQDHSVGSDQYNWCVRPPAQTAGLGVTGSRLSGWQQCLPDEVSMHASMPPNACAKPASGPWEQQ